MNRPSTKKRGRALTLTEVMIAVSILAVVVLGSITSLIVSSNLSKAALEDLEALEFANRQTELLKSNRSYTNLGVTEWVNNDPSKLWTTFQYDPATDFGKQTAPTYSISYQWYGFGNTTAATTSSVSFNGSTWPKDLSLKDHRIVLRPTTGGASSAAIARIDDVTGLGTTNTTIKTNSAMNGWTATTWEFSVPNNTYFEVDGGKWCRMTITWKVNTGIKATRTRTYVRDIFVPWRP